MALIKSKQEEITFKKVELTEDKQTAAKKYVEKLNSLIEHRQGLEAMSAAAVTRNQQIREELDSLNVEQALELDMDKLKAIDAKRRELKGEALDLFILDDSKIKMVIRESFKSEEVKALAAASGNEHRAFNKEVDELMKELNTEIERLKRIKREHLNTHSEHLQTRIFS